MHRFHLLGYVLSVGAIVFGFVGSLADYAPSVTHLPMPAVSQDATSTPPSKSTAVIATSHAPAESTAAPAPQAPNIPGLTRLSQVDAQGKLVSAQYQNSNGVFIARFEPQDELHNNGVTWYWEKMAGEEKEQALRWLFDRQQMQYADFGGLEDHVANAVTKWIPAIGPLSNPTDPRIASHWQTDGPPLDQVTLYEALSRIKSLSLARERRMCSYGYSQLGLVEYGGEIMLFTAPGWQQVSAETREIVTAVWTIKEAMVIYYPQSLGWANACPSESAHLKNEYYSTIWLLETEQALSRFVPTDNSYWLEQEIPFQVRNIQTAAFPRCLAPARLPVPTSTAESEGCTSMP